MLKNGYKVKILNTINFKKSMHYNPFSYVHSEKDILKLVTTLMTNTKGEGSGGDPFWEKSERLLLTALIAYLHYEAPVEEQNFATLLEMLNTMQVLLSINGLTAETTSIAYLIENGMANLEAAKQQSLYTTMLGFFVNNSGVFGGIIVGVVVAAITTKFYNTKLPTALSFFAGTRTVPIVALVAGGALGVAMHFVWPIIGSGLANLAEFINASGLVGTFVYRMCDECLVPFGMHPIMSTPFRYTELGGVMMVDGTRVVGNAAIQLAQLASPSTDKLLVRAFMGASGVVNYAVYPAIALAMWTCAKPQNKAKVAGLLIPTIVSTVSLV